MNIVTETRFATVSSVCVIHSRLRIINILIVVTKNKIKFECFVVKLQYSMSVTASHKWISQT